MLLSPLMLGVDRSVNLFILTPLVVSTYGFQMLALIFDWLFIVSWSTSSTKVKLDAKG